MSLDQGSMVFKIHNWREGASWKRLLQALIDRHWRFDRSGVFFHAPAGAEWQDIFSCETEDFDLFWNILLERISADGQASSSLCNFDPIEETDGATIKIYDRKTIGFCPWNSRKIGQTAFIDSSYYVPLFLGPVWTVSSCFDVSTQQLIDRIEP